MMRPHSRLTVFLSMALLSVHAGRAAEPDRKTHPLSVLGRALDSKGMAVPGATIYLVSTNGISEVVGETKADEDGRYAFRDLPLPIPAPASRAYFEYGSFRVIGRAGGHACAWRATRHLLLDPRFQFDSTARSAGFLPGEEISLDLKFENPYSFTGRVVDEQGQPIAGAKVTITNCDFFEKPADEPQPLDPSLCRFHDGAQFLPEEFVTFSDEAGRFAFKSIAPERFCLLKAEHADYVWFQTRVATSENPPKRDFSLRPLPVAITLQRKHAIPVRVWWGDTGRPAAGVSVWAIPEPNDALGYNRAGTTDQDGNVVLNIPRGKYRLRGEPPAEAGYLVSTGDLVVDEQPRQTLVPMDIPRGARLILRVVDDKSGQGVPEASIWCKDRNAAIVDIGSISTPSGYRTTNADGEIQAVIAPGTRHYGFSPGQQSDYRGTDPVDMTTGREFTIAAGETATIEFKASLRPDVERPKEVVPVAEVEASEVIAGRVIYDGPPPPRRIIAGALGPGIRGMNRGPPTFDESVLVDPETHGLANVVIYIDKAPPGVAVPPRPKSSVAVEIVDGHFQPRVSVLRCTQLCFVTNKDPDPTNVHLQTIRNSGLNQVLSQHKTIKWRHNKPERSPILMQSDFFPALKAYQVVSDHPWVAVTDKTGKFAIRGLPPGKYQFKVWHETPGYLEKALAIEVKPGEVTELTRKYSPDLFGLR